MQIKIRDAWRMLRPTIKSGCTFSEIKDIVAFSSLPIEKLSHLQQRSLPLKGASKGELLDAIDDLLSADENPDGAISRLINALVHIKPHLRDKVTALIQPIDSILQNEMTAENVDENLEIFISHSSRDADVAAALIELIRAALEIPHARIRCTSVDGYRLTAGASTDNQLQQEVRDSRCFIALLTPTSLKSSYVLFELGARWGAKLNCFPLLARGLSANSLEKPISSLNALSCTSTAQIHQFLGDIGRVLGRSLCSPAAYDRYLQPLQAFNTSVSGSNDQNESQVHPEQILPGDTPIGTNAKQLLELIEQEADVEHRGIVEILKEVEPGQTMFFPRIQYGGKPLRMKSRLFREAVNQLVSANHLLSPEDNPSRNTRTYEYRCQDNSSK